MPELASAAAIIGQPEVLEHGRAMKVAKRPSTSAPREPVSTDLLATHPSWLDLKAAAIELQGLQIKDGSVPDDTARAEGSVDVIRASVKDLAPLFPHDDEYLKALDADFEKWTAQGFGVPDFLDALTAFQPQRDRVDGLRHLVIFPMLTQNGSSSRLVEAVLIEVIWPEFVAELEAGDYSNTLFVPIRFIDFTPGYDTNSAVLFPETVAMRDGAAGAAAPKQARPAFTWGAIFADREAARFRRVVREAASVTRLHLPDDAAALLDDQTLAEETFVMWDLIHDRTHMRGDLPFDPFMIKQRMPFFLYSLEELRCDLTAYREAVKLSRELGAIPDAEITDTQRITRERAHLVQYAVIFDRIFRFALSGSRVRNYDALGGQLLFAWLHQHRVLHWTDTRLTIDWDAVPEVVIALGHEIEELYWRSIDRPKTAHWLAAYDLVSATVTPHPASTWASRDLPLAGPPKALTDAVLDDEFPLSMFYEAMAKKMAHVIESTAGITAASA